MRTDRAPRRPSRRQQLLLVLLGVGLVLLAELGARLAGFGGAPPLLRSLAVEAADGGVLYEINPGVAATFFAQRGPDGTSMVGEHRRELVVRPKPIGRVRVLVLGASSVEGFPLPRNLTASRFLEAWLRELLPGGDIEVLNLGITAVASFPVRVIGLEAIAELEPDAVVVYVGHNELYGAGGVASRQFLGRRVGVMDAVLALRQTGIFQLAQSISRPGAPAPGNRRSNLIEVMAAVPSIAPGGDLHRAAEATLATNLERLVEAAGRRKVPLLLATVASNEGGLAPIASYPETEPPPIATAPEEEIATLRTFLEAQPEHAAARFRLARAYERSDEKREAEEAYRRARDDDAMPWRATRAVNARVRALAAEHRVPLADCEAGFADAADGVPSWDLFYDHVHPSLRGQAVLAATVLETMATERMLGLTPIATAGRSPWRVVARELGAHPLEHYLVVHKMRTLFSTPPLGVPGGEPARRFAKLLDELDATLDPVDRAAVESWRQASRQAGFVLPISYFAAVAALRADRAERALTYAVAAVENALPSSDERIAARYLLVLAQRRVRDDQAAATELERARAETAALLRSPREPSALLLGAAAELALLDNAPTVAQELRQGAAELTAEAPPWTRAFLDQLPSASTVEGPR